MFGQDNNLLSVLKQGMNSSWAKEQNVMILVSPDNSLKVCEDEKAHYGAGIFKKMLKRKI